MAKVVKLPKGKEFVFAKVASKGAAPKYPWDEWFNGDLLLLEQSTGSKNEKGTVVTISQKKDYEVDTDQMPPKIKTAARARYKVVEVSRRDHEGNRLQDAVIIRARDMTDEERTTEDILRVEEKAALAAKKAEAKATAQTNGHAAETVHEVVQ